MLADSIARFKRKDGYDVFFQTGTDEHGLKVEQKAAEKGVTPKQFVDSVAAEIKRIWDLMNVSYDKFMRTTDDYHERAVQKISPNFIIGAIFTRARTRGFIAHPVKVSGRKVSL